MKKFTSLLLAVLVAFSLCVPAMAAEKNGFQKVNTYTEGQFSDVPADAWCAANVQTAYEYGIMGGKTVYPSFAISVSAIQSSQLPLHSSISPASHFSAISGSIGILAVTGIPYFFAVSSIWLSPKMR